MRTEISRRQFIELTTASGLGLAVTGLASACAGQGNQGNQRRSDGELIATYMSSGTYDKAAEEIASEFGKQHEIEVTIAAFPWTTLIKNNSNDLLTGVGKYDVLSGVAAGLWENLAPLDSYIEKDSYKPPFVSGLLEKMPYAGGAIAGLPYGPDAYSMAVRIDLFEEAGIDVPESGWTWDEFDSTLEELDAAFKDRGISAFVLAAGAVDQLAPFFWGRYDGYHYTGDEVMKHDEELSVQALERLKRHVSYGPNNVLGLSIDEASAVFLDGNACILECWPSFTRAALVDPDQSQVVDKWAFVPYPTPGFDYLAVWYLSISEFSGDQDIGWEWIKAYINKENDVRFFEKYGIGPAMTTTYKNDELVQQYSNDFPATLANLQRAKQPVVTDEAELFLGQTVSEVINDISTPEAGITKVNEKWASMKPIKAEFELAKRQDLVQS